MSQIPDCPINKSVVFSFDAAEGKQSTFPLEQNLDVLISSMLSGINNEYTKPISVVPAGSTKDVLAPFVKLNTQDVVIVPPTVEIAPVSVVAPVVAEPVVAEPVVAPVNQLLVPDNTILPGVPTPAPFNPEPVVFPPTPNQPLPNVTVPTPLELPSPTVKIEKFANNTTSSTKRSNDRAGLISKIIGFFFLIIIIYLLLVKMNIIKCY
jgi:hypothetical protein